MKNKSFMVIILASLVIFIGLLFSIYKVVTKEKEVFYASGYVSLADAENSEKVYFTSGTSYKRGYGKEVIFKDADNIKQEVGKYNFVFYENKSINFLNDGVILDLNSIGSSFVPYYNIKSNYLIEYNSGKYVIDSTDKDVVIDNFIGRINDNKYIVAGNDLHLKLSSSEDLVSSYYFELNFIDGQTVKIDSEEINVETISEECYILVGSDIKIDLSNQVIFYGEEAKINLSEIIINHDENIDILYEEPEEEVVIPGGNAGGSGSGGTGGNVSGDGSGEGAGSGSGEGAGGGAQYPEYKVETVVEYKNIPYVEFISSNVNSHKMEFQFNVIDKNSLITGPVTVRYVDLKSGASVEKEYINYTGTLDFTADGLKSDSDYLVTIFASYVRNNNIYNNYSMFQRTFSTKELGVSLEKDYVTNDELSYNIRIDSDATFTEGVVNLYDKDGNLISSQTFENKGRDLNVTFSELKSDTKYIVKIENITGGDGSIVVAEQKTLKYNPFKDGAIVTSPVAIVNKKDYHFTFEIGDIKDTDIAISGVVYNVYEKDSGKLVKSIKKETLNSFDVSLDEDIKDHTTYYYKAVISLNDNEKKIDYETLASNDFNMDVKASPTMRFTTTGITANTLSGYFTITDPDNAIDTSQSVYVEYTNSLGVINTQILEFGTCADGESDTTKCVNLDLEELSSNDVYTINLMAYVDVNDEKIEPGHIQIGAIKLTTEEADIVLTDMYATELDETQAFEKVFEVNMQFSIDELTDVTIKDNMSSFDISLFEGAEATGAYLGSIHVDQNIVAEFFDNVKTYTLADFGLSLDDLIKLHITSGGQISKKYSIKLDHGRSGEEFVEFKPAILTFEINDVLLGLTNEDASIEVTTILNSESGEFRDDTLNGDTIVGLRVLPDFGNKKFATQINFVIKDVTDENDIKYKEHTADLNLEEGSIIPMFDFMFVNDPSFFKRGRVYVIEYTVNLDLNVDGVTDVVYPFSAESITEPAPVVSEAVYVAKQAPSMILFPWVSDTNSIFYKYSVTDVDGALPSEYKVYYQVGENSFEAISTICENSSSIKAYQSAYQCMRLTGLNAGDNYQIYLNPILVEKAGTPETRVDINNFTFEGIHDLANVRYDLELGEDGKSKYNNMISLKISEPYDYLSEDEKLLNTPIKNRIAYYTLEFTVANTDKKFVINNITDSTRQTAPISSNIIEYTSGGKKITWNNQNDRDNLSRVAYVAVCDDGVSTCLYVDYSKLYNSQTFKNVFSELRNQNILVSLNAVYDTGIISYLGNAQNKYVFQVMANNLIEFAGRTYNDNYLLVHGRNIGGVSFSPAALSAVYAYVNSQGGFVDDGADDVVIGSGKIYFINTIYSNLSIVAPNYNYFDAKYQVTSQGIEITFGYGADQITVPLVAKELNTASLNGIGSFAYEQVIPAINVTSKNEIINGIKLDLSLSGITDNDITEESGKRFVYLEIYDSATNEVVKSLKINKNGLTSQVGSVQNNQYQITFDDNYKVDVTQVRTSSGVITDYAYDYKTGLITFNGLEDGTNITVYYRLVLDELNVGSTYYLKAYMLVNNKKSYLVDMLSNTYETFSYEFTTKNASDVKISSASLDVVSKTDYATRHLLTTYNIDEIVGIDNLEYEICNSDKSICVPVNKYQVCENSYNHYDGTCFTKTNGYDSTITHDISISDDLDFVYNTNYNVVIKAKVKEANGNTNSYEIFNQPLNLRALKRPSVNVIQNTGFKDGKNAYLSFDISFTDNDRVVSKPEVNKEKGQYIVYLAMGDNKTKIEGTEKLINIVENGADKMTTITYENLDKNTAYYLTVIYSSYANNVGEVAEDPQSTDYLVYTLDDNGVSVGRYEYTAQGTTTTLKFGYATNMVRDYIAVEGSAPIPDPNQEAFVSGIVYTITRTSGDNLFAINGTKIFDDEVKIVLKNDGDALGAIGETYYQLDIPNTVYPVSAGYDILFQFYLGGQISAHLNSESLCKDDSPSNYWSSVNNECYILDSTKYHENTQYGNGGTK